MCKEWLENFDAFWDNGYNPELSLGREDVDKGYSQFELHRLNSRPQGHNPIGLALFLHGSE